MSRPGWALGLARRSLSRTRVVHLNKTGGSAVGNRNIHTLCSHFRWLHLLFNLGVQVVVGLPLEMVHGSLRIAAVYMAGVLAGE